MKSSVSHITVLKVDAEGQSALLPDLLSVEEPLEIRLSYGPENQRKKKAISVTMRSPGNDFELALGFLFTEGIIKNNNDVAHIRFCSEVNSTEAEENIVIVELKPNVVVNLEKLERNFYTTSSCGVCGKASIEAVKNSNCPVIEVKGALITDNVLHNLPETLRQKQAVFEYTGGLHACALFTYTGNMLLVREDVGRHNALDKLIGAAINAQTISAKETLLMLSGRISFELVQKAAMAGIPIIAAVGAPSSLAVQSAQALGITLIGFLRNNRFNIYSHPKRVTLSSK